MANSILSNWLGLIVNGALAFFLTPLLLTSLGNYYYGLFILISSTLECYGILDIGLRTTLQRFVARLYGMRDQFGLHRVLMTSLVSTLGICGVICLLTAVLAVWMPTVLGEAVEARSITSKLLILLGLSAAMSFPARILGAYLCGLHRFDLFNLAAIITGVVRAVLLFAALRMGRGVLAVGVVTLAVSALSLLLNWRLLRGIRPDLTFKLGLTSLSCLKELVSFSVFVFITSVGDQLRFNAASFVIARWLSVAMVTPFSVAAKLMEYLKLVLFGASGPLMPAMSHLEAQGKRQELRNLLLHSTTASMLLSLLGGVLLTLDGERFLVLWLGPAFASVHRLVIILAVAYVAALGQTPTVAALYACAHQRPVAYWTIAEGVANVALCIYLAPKLGLAGVAMGMAAPMLVVKLLVQPWYAIKVLGHPCSGYILAVARPLLAATCFLFVENILPAEARHLPFLITVAWHSVLFALFGWLIGLNSQEKEFVFLAGRRLLRARSEKVAFAESAR